VWGLGNRPEIQEARKMKFIVFSEFGEILDLASYLSHVEGHEVLFHVHDKHSETIGRGVVPHLKNWFNEIGKGYTWIFDSCSFGALQDWLRSRGEAVFGGCERGDELENSRQLNQVWFKEAGFDQVFSKNFTSLDSAQRFIEKHVSGGKRYILKQNGDAPKGLSHLGKFEHGEDMLWHLNELQRSWNEAEYGKFDCDIMEVVEGLEVAASVLFNGQDYCRNSEGKIMGYLNFEEKKEADGGLGETCGEMGTTFLSVTEEHPLFKKILVREALVAKLREIGFRGMFDVNCIVTEKGKIVGLEPTMRLGVPATSYELLEGMASPAGEVLDSVARGASSPVELHEGLGMVMCVVAKPFPLEADVETNATSVGQRLWILDKKGEPQAEFSEEQRKHIHLYNFELAQPAAEEQSEHSEGSEAVYKVATKNGYMLTATGHGQGSIRVVRKHLIEYIKSNLYLSGMKFRSDIGQRVEEHEQDLLDT
jgi:phosphoribosylamine-glycine ligase